MKNQLRPQVPTPETSARMKAVRQRNTKPEIAVRRVLHRVGVKYRLCPPGLPGRPDIANATRNWCIFVHGCFWHGHEDCPLFTVPKTNTEWWKHKVADNRARDLRKESGLRKLGFRVAVIWQCETRNAKALEERLVLFLAGPPTGGDEKAATVD
jgi:DNA mismatch endonuclease (patch repair protein)